MFAVHFVNTCCMGAPWTIYRYVRVTSADPQQKHTLFGQCGEARVPHPALLTLICSVRPSSLGSLLDPLLQEACPASNTRRQLPLSKDATLKVIVCAEVSKYTLLRKVADKA